MSKSILIINTPSSCDNCPLCILLDKYRCTVENKRWCGDEEGYFTSKTKPSWCPLKPLPKREPEHFTSFNGEEVHDVYFQGWNDCIDEIMEEKDEQGNYNH